MQSVSDKQAGFAALTLVESLLVHLQETGILGEGDRDLIYDIAISAHLEVEHGDPSPDHKAIAALLRILQTRSDGVKIVGDFDKGPDEASKG